MSAQLNFRLIDLAPWLENLGERLKQIRWSRAFKKIALVLQGATQTCFETGTAPDGTRWKPLAQPRNRQRDQRAREGEGNAQRPLRDTGLLMASLSANGPEHLEEISDSVLNWGTNVVYAGVHQFGHTFQRPERRRGPGEKPWVFQTPDGRTVFTKRIKAHSQHVPARPFLGLNPEILGDIDAILRDEVLSVSLGEEPPQ